MLWFLEAVRFYECEPIGIGYVKDINNCVVLTSTGTAIQYYKKSILERHFWTKLLNVFKFCKIAK